MDRNAITIGFFTFTNDEFCCNVMEEVENAHEGIEIFLQGFLLYITKGGKKLIVYHQKKTNLDSKAGHVLTDIFIVPK